MSRQNPELDSGSHRDADAQTRIWERLASRASSHLALRATLSCYEILLRAQTRLSLSPPPRLTHTDRQCSCWCSQEHSTQGTGAVCQSCWGAAALAVSSAHAIHGSHPLPHGVSAGCRSRGTVAQARRQCTTG
jgi:hypothetical protein